MKPMQVTEGSRPSSESGEPGPATDGNEARPWGGLKPAQWIGALGVLVVMVFLITFAVTYTGCSSGPQNDSGPSLQLTFSETVYPKETPNDPKATMPPIIMEAHQDGGYYDFPFQNPNDQTVKVGLASKGCTCSSVDLFLAPEGWEERGNAVNLRAAGLLGCQGTISTLDSLTAAALCTHALDERRKLSDSVHGTALDPTEPNKTAEVPAGARGWVRLGWKGKPAGAAPENLTATLWTGQPGKPSVTLRVRVHFREPLFVPVDQFVNNVVHVSGLEGKIICVSPTRETLNLKTTLLGPYGENSGADPVILGTPHRVRLLAGYGAVSVYEIPVTVRPTSQDVRDCGPFLRYVKIEETTTGVTQGPIAVGGDVAGELTVSPSRIEFGNSSSGTIEIRTTTQNLNLEVDRERTSDFLECNLGSPTAAAGGVTSWKLEVKLKGTVSGNFPDASDPRLRDSAVYLRPANRSEKNSWRHRIPVSNR
jgi:hypothetical protein